MSAIDPLKSGPRRYRLRALRGKGAPTRREADDRGEPVLKCSYRPAGADFYCWKFGVWYNLLDCCYRHAFRTYSGCTDCGQGSSNLKARRQRINAYRARISRSFAR